MKFAKLLTLGVCVMLFGCGGVDPKVYEGKEPKFTMKTFFDRNMEAYGQFTNRSGEVTVRYYVQMEPEWNGNKGILKEKFYQDDGKEMTRQWNITVIDDTHFTATADDVTGEGKGEVRGYAMNMKYVLNVPRGDSTIAVNVDDWIFLQPDGTAINNAKVSKFGIHVGDIRFSFRKLAKGEKFKETYFIK